MTTKKQLRSENIKEKKIKKSTKIFYLFLIIGGGIVLLVIFFVTLFSAIFPPVDMDAMNKEKKVAKIYFSDQQELFLKPEKRFVIKENDIALQTKEIVKALLGGSKNGLVNTFPQGVTVRDVKISGDGIASVSFSKDLVKSYKGSSTSEMATIYSLTNSIIQNIPTIKKVKILVEGKELPSIKGHISTRKAFSPDLELIIPENQNKN